jgi:hypothetical protein
MCGGRRSQVRPASEEDSMKLFDPKSKRDGPRRRRKQGNKIYVIRPTPEGCERILVYQRPEPKKEVST